MENSTAKTQKQYQKRKEREHGVESNRRCQDLDLVFSQVGNRRFDALKKRNRGRDRTVCNLGNGLFSLHFVWNRSRIWISESRTLILTQKTKFRCKIQNTKQLTQKIHL